MTTKRTPNLCLWILFIGLMVSCSVFSPMSKDTTPTASQTEAKPISSSTALASPTDLPTFFIPTFVEPTATPKPTPMPAKLPLFPLEGYVMVFVKDSYLYFQDGNNPPVKLTNTGKLYDSYAISDDNQKVVFFRSNGNEYSINTDGTRKQIIIANITNEWPPSPLHPGTNKVIVGFVPHTHLVLFQTAVCETQKYESPCSTSLFLTDTDTGVIKKLGDFGLSLQQDNINKNVGVSPDGTMVAIGTINGVDILTLDGKIIRHDILPYKPSTSTVLFQSLFWLPDSSGLIVGLPTTFFESSAYDSMTGSTIWRFTISNNTSMQIPVDPPPPLDTFQVSPDGNWIVYGGIANEETLLLGNLTNGNIQNLGAAYMFRVLWSPDSQHFIPTNAESFLGAINSPTLTPICQLKGKWIDAAHFICFNNEGNEHRVRMAELDAGGIKIYDLGFDNAIEASLIIKPK
jgi:hypothetical protein